MPAIEYTPNNFSRIRPHKEPFIHIVGARGVITISASASRVMNLKSGGCIKFIQDSERKNDIYIQIHPDGFPIKGLEELSKRSASLSSKGIVMLLADIANFSYKSSFDMQISSYPEESGEFKGMYAVITKSAVIKEVPKLKYKQKDDARL